MRKDDFITNITKDIENKRNVLSGINGEIAVIESEINDLKSKIANYTDVDDIRSYSELKDKLEVRENKIELLKRNRKAESGCLDEMTIGQTISEFMTAKIAIDKKYAEEMLEIIRKLNDKYIQAEAERNRLKSIYESWISTYNIPSYKFERVENVDSTGVSSNVQRLINSVKATNKL